MTTTTLYRHFGKDGDLLYVGISLSWPSRTNQHAKGSRWFDQVARVEIERFETREAALVAEREAIKREKPQFNIIHNRPVAAARSAWKPKKPHFADPLLNAISGPDAFVGPALVYRDDQISVLVAHGEPGTAGHLTELQLGQLATEVPEWAYLVDTLLVLRKANEQTMEEAQAMRGQVIEVLRANLRSVEGCDTDLALALAYSSTFPSAESRQILEDVAAEQSATITKA